MPYQPVRLRSRSPIALLDGVPISDRTLYPTGRGTVLVLGSVVVDRGALATLLLPAEETAVEIYPSLPTSVIKQEVRA